MIFEKESSALVARRGGETLRIEAWGKDALRVRAYMADGKSSCDWALTEKPEACACEVRIGEEPGTGDAVGSVQPCAEIVNGRIRATGNFAGVGTFFRDGRMSLREDVRF